MSCTNELGDDLVDERNEVAQLECVWVLEQLLHGNRDEGQDLVVQADDQTMQELSDACVQRLRNEIQS